MIGRKADEAALGDGVERQLPLAALRVDREVDLRMAFFLTMPITMMSPTKA